MLREHIVMGKKITSATQKTEIAASSPATEKAPAKLKRAKKSAEPTPTVAAEIPAKAIAPAKPARKPASDKKQVEPEALPVAEVQPVVNKPKAPRAKSKAEATQTEATSTTAVPVAPITLSHDDIALRAYFIAEKRQQLGLPGDPSQDWVEAERQLRQELPQPSVS